MFLEIVPPVWRRLRVPAQWTLRQLHSGLRCALGCPGGEAHRFRVGGTLYGKTSDGAHPRDSRWMTLGDVVATGADSFRYELGFDDENWEYEVLIESVAEGTADNQQPLCLAGEHAWPPESLEGPEASLNRVDFLGAETFDAGGFDLDAINRALARLR